LNCKINGQEVRFVFDSGSEDFMLLRETAKRLGLKIITKRASGASDAQLREVPHDMAEDFALSLGASEIAKCELPIFDIPNYIHPNFDGIIGWKAFAIPLIEIAPEGERLRVLSKLPSDMTAWNRWKLVPDESTLTFECGSGAECARISIDTGSPGGVELSSERWQRWRAACARHPGTVEARYSQEGNGFRVYEMFRAKEVDLNGFRLPDMPVMQFLQPKSRHVDAVIGLFGFTRLRVIIDRKDGWLYTKGIDAPWIDYHYNRLGAQFIPVDPGKDDELIGHVSEGSPAYNAGIRNGDYLLAINGRDVTKWREEPPGLITGYFIQPAGTELTLTLQCGAESVNKKVILADPLPN
jgi:hypothetical protein